MMFLRPYAQDQISHYTVGVMLEHVLFLAILVHMCNRKTSEKDHDNHGYHGKLEPTCVGHKMPRADRSGSLRKRLHR